MAPSNVGSAGVNQNASHSRASERTRSAEVAEDPVQIAVASEVPQGLLLVAFRVVQPTAAADPSPSSGAGGSAASG